MKRYTGGKQMRSDWVLPLCTGEERIRIDGEKAHSTQKPEALLERVIMASPRVGDVVLDPFSGSGTTAAVAKRLGRHWIGIELDPAYVRDSRERVAAVCMPDAGGAGGAGVERAPPRPRVPFRALLERGLLSPGEALRQDLGVEAVILSDGQLEANGLRGSIHRVAARPHAPSANGWHIWLYEDTKAAVACHRAPQGHRPGKIREGAAARRRGADAGDMTGRHPLTAHQQRPGGALSPPLKRHGNGRREQIPAP